MKSSLVISALVHIMLLTTAMSQELPGKISIDTLNHVRIVGRIGVHLGKAVVVDVVVSKDDHSGSKAAQGHYFLEVRTVDGIPLKSRVFMRFQVRGGNMDDDDPFGGGAGGGAFRIPTNSFELYRLKHGREAKELSSKDISELEKGFIGRQYRLLAYETGGYSGLPKGLPTAYPVWQDHGFAFSSYLMVLGEHK